VLVIGLLGASCTTGSGVTSTTDTGQPVETVMPTAPTPSASPATTPSTFDPETPLPIEPVVRIPEGDGPFPVVVLVHGGSWVGGNTEIMDPLARFLSDEGYLTINTDYTLAGDRPGFPGAMNDVACAVRLGRTHPDGDGTVTLLGHSAGAHIAAVVALTGDGYADRCPIPGSGIPDRFVGLSGPYDISRLGLVMYPFLGGGPGVEPDAWEAANPLHHVHANVGLETLLLHGDQDGLVNIGFSFDFDTALNDAGSESLVEIVEGANHTDTLDPTIVGGLIVTWLER
jgi:acetyl esterase/lipase